MSAPRWMLYGANGYTGELIADAALARGMRPLLAGRNRAAIEAMGQRLDLEVRVFTLDDPDSITRALEEVDAIVLAAGPFSRTSAPVVAGCLRTNTHYLDITGELDVFLACHEHDLQARETGCTLMPGVGFDIVPTDCLAVALKEALPTATHLELAVQALSGFSQGTAKTVMESLGGPAYVTRDGALVAVPMGRDRIEATFGDRQWPAIAAPIADGFTAHLSTGIPNVSAYAGISPRLIKRLDRWRWAMPAMRSKTLQAVGKRLVELRPRGPDEGERERGHARAWGRVRDAEGNTRTGSVLTPEAYAFTADSALVCLAGILAGEAPVGFQTPASAFGSDLILRCASCELRVDAA